MNEVIIKNLSISFGKQIIFDNLNLSFKGNGLYAIVAPSGYGKSTLFNIICRFVKPDQGMVRTKGKILYSFQNARLFNNLSVKENLFLLLNDESVTERMIQSVLNSLSIGRYLDKKVSKLSSGEYQRVLIAETLLSRADILIIDEPLKYLDKNNRELVLRLLKKKALTSLVIASGHEQGDFDDYAKEIVDPWTKHDFSDIGEEIPSDNRSDYVTKKLSKNKKTVIWSLVKNNINLIYIVLASLFSLTSSGLYQTSLKANDKMAKLYETSGEIAQIDVQLQISNAPRIITNSFLEQLESVDDLDAFYPNLLPTFNKFSSNGFFINNQLVQGIYYNDENFKNDSSNNELKIGISPKIAKAYFNSSSTMEIINKTVEYALNLSFHNASTNKDYHINISIPFVVDNIVDNEIDFNGLYFSFADVISYINSATFYVNEDDENISPLYDYLADSANYLTSGNNRIACYNVLLQFPNNESSLNYLHSEEIFGNQEVIKTNYYIDMLSTIQLFSFVNVNVFQIILVVTQILLLISTIVFVYFADKHVFSPLYLLEIRGYNPRDLRKIKFGILSSFIVFSPIVSMLAFPTLLNIIFTLSSLLICFAILLVFVKVSKKIKPYQKLYE